MGEEHQFVMVLLAKLVPNVIRHAATDKLSLLSKHLQAKCAMQKVVQCGCSSGSVTSRLD